MGSAGVDEDENEPGTRIVKVVGRMALAQPGRLTFRQQLNPGLACAFSIC